MPYVRYHLSLPHPNICRRSRLVHGLADSLSGRITWPEIDSSYSPDFRNGVKWEMELFMCATDCLRVRTFSEAVSFAFRDVHVCAQICPAFLFACRFKLQIDFNELGFAYPLGGPTPLSSIMRVDKIFHGSPGLNNLGIADAEPLSQAMGCGLQIEGFFYLGVIATRSFLIGLAV